jgi:hypothetical protein
LTLHFRGCGAGELTFVDYPTSKDLSGVNGPKGTLLLHSINICRSGLDPYDITLVGPRFTEARERLPGFCVLRISPDGQNWNFLLDNRTLYKIKEKGREYLLWADLPWSGATNSEC